MTGWQVACVTFSAGWAVAVVAIWLLASLSDKGGDTDSETRSTGITVPRWTAYVLAVLAFAGVGTCAAEDRVCEIAGVGVDSD